MNLKLALFVFAAGGLGSVARWTISQLTTWPSIGVNLIGSFLMGLCFSWMLSRELESSFQSTILMAGFLGGFTTFSAFSLELLSFAKEGDYLRLFQYAALSVCLGLAACMAGFYALRILER
ncbi:CrcB family protein [bacterium]|nr:CrcB family protein [bacterium]